MEVGNNDFYEILHLKISKIKTVHNTEEISTENERFTEAKTFSHLLITIIEYTEPKYNQY